MIINILFFVILIICFKQFQNIIILVLIFFDSINLKHQLQPEILHPQVSLKSLIFFFLFVI